MEALKSPATSGVAPSLTHADMSIVNTPYTCSTASSHSQDVGRYTEKNWNLTFNIGAFNAQTLSEKTWKWTWDISKANFRPMLSPTPQSVALFTLCDPPKGRHFEIFFFSKSPDKSCQFFPFDMVSPMVSAPMYFSKRSYALVPGFFGFSCWILIAVLGDFRAATCVCESGMAPPNRALNLKCQLLSQRIEIKNCNLHYRAWRKEPTMSMLTSQPIVLGETASQPSHVFLAYGNFVERTMCYENGKASQSSLYALQQTFWGRRR